MKSYLPQPNKKYLEINRSNILGNVWSTKGIDLQSNLGAARLAQKLVTNTTSSDDANLGRPGAFAHFDGRYFATCGSRIFNNSGNNVTSSFTVEASTGAPTDCDPDVTDLAVFDDRLWVSAKGGLYSKVANGSGTGAYTSRSSSSTAANRKLLYFKKTDLLYFVDTNTSIASINATNVRNFASSGDANAIELGKSVNSITTIVGNINNIWIGTLVPSDVSNAIETYGSVMQWDGISAQITAELPIQAAGVLAMCVLDDIPYAMDTEGRLLKYSGYAFKEVSRLPINRTLLTRATSQGSSGVATNGRFISANGLVATKNNTILALINNLNDDNAGSITENLCSGIWEFDLATGNCTQRYCFTLSSLASSTVTDFGQNRVLSAGALSLNTLGFGSSAGRGTLIAGAGYYTDASTSKTGIFIDSPVNATTDNEGQKRGYIVSTFVESEEAEENWGRIWATFRKFRSSTDNLIFKYRTTEEDSVEATITWTSTSTFTTTTDVTAYAATATGFNGATGGEAEIIQGTGAGATPQILTVVNNAGTYTVTLNEAVTGVTGTAKARFQKWLLIGDAYTVTTQRKSWAQIPVDNLANEARIQLKICFQWTGAGEFYRSVLWSNTNQKITN